MQVLKVKRYRMQVRDVPVVYEVCGSGQPLILVHGLSGSTRWWYSNIQALSEHFQLYIIDLIGFGENRSGSRFALSEAAIHLYNWLGALKIERACFIGHSMGGHIVAELAADHPEKVERMILVDPAIYLPVSRLISPRHALNLALTIRYLPPNFWPILLQDARHAGPVTLFNAARELLSAHIEEKVGEIKVPTMLVWGEHDPLVPLSSGHRLKRHMPQAVFKLIKGAGHVPMVEQPALFNRLALNFLGPGATPS
ncbi:MAG TPA: alpha/beta hydrolase [Chloroflexia bacterium]|nr:alpha/beta hydrolase [Chloroflexia bacterium]